MICLAAVEFLWDSCVESIDQRKKGHEGSGCILAHCMGMGKTLSAIAFVHTLMKSKECNFHTFLVVCPLNTVLNWHTEWTKWLDKRDRLQVIDDECTDDVDLVFLPIRCMKWPV
jgi:transcriptional regulator ATRX